MRMNFYDLWQQYDVIGNNQVEVEQMASFMKKLLHDPTIQIQWALIITIKYLSQDIIHYNGVLGFWGFCWF